VWKKIVASGKHTKQHGAKLPLHNRELYFWMMNDFPPYAAWVTCCSGQVCRHPTRPPGSATAKCVLFVVGIDQLYAGLEADIEGGIHAMRLLWDTHLAEEEWGFLLLVDVKNAFNEGNQCWTICHLVWPSCEPVHI
jgi:hypothetical protein